MSRKRVFAFNLIRLILAGLFLFFSYKTIIYSVDYFLKKLHGYGLSFQNLEFNFGKEFEIKFKKVLYKDKGFCFKGSDGDILIDVVESLKRKKLVFEKIYLSNFDLYMENNEENAKGFDISKLNISFPVYIETLFIGKGKIKSEEFNINFQGIHWNKDSFCLLPISGYLYGKSLKISELKGVVEGNLVKTKDFKIDYGSYRVKGKLSFSKDFNKISFSGDLNYKDILDSKFYLNKKGVIFESSAVINYIPFSKKVLVSVVASISHDSLDFKGSYKFLTDSFSGKFEGSYRKDLEFTLNGLGDIVLKKYFLKDINLNLSYTNKSLSAQAFVKDIVFADRDFKNVNVVANLKNGSHLTAEFAFSGSTRAAGKITGNIKNRNFDCYLRVDDFNLKKDPLIVSLSNNVKAWIPKVQGNLELKVYVRNNQLQDFQLSGVIDDFDFRGFKAKGIFSFRNKTENLLGGNITLSGSDGTVVFTGNIDYKNLYLEGQIDFKNILLNSIDFLKEQGLKGKVSGSGSISGKLKSLTGVFDFSSDDFKYFTQDLGAVSGKAVFVYPHLDINAKSLDGKVDLKRLSMSFSPNFSLSLNGSFKDFNLESLEPILSNYHVSLPVKLSGVADGNVILNFKRGSKESFYLNVAVNRAVGKYSLSDFIHGSGTAKGYVKFAEEKLSISLKGKSEKFYLGSTVFEGGDYSLLLNNETLFIKGEKVSFPLFDKSDISFSLKSNLNLKELDGNVKFSAFKSIEIGKLRGKGDIKILGKFEKLLLTLNGNGSFDTSYLKLPFNFKGKIAVPDIDGDVRIDTNFGSGDIKLNKDNMKILANVKDFRLKTSDILLDVGLGFVNLEVKNFNFDTLSGEISIPVFSFKFKDYPKVNSISGVFLKVNNKKFILDDASFAFRGGWFTLSKCVYSKDGLNGSYSGEVSLKTLVETLGLKDLLTFRRGELNFKGNFAYQNGLHYTLNLNGSRIVFDYKYILVPVKVEHFFALIRDGKVEKLAVKANASGDIVLSGDKDIAITFISIPIGDREVFRAKVTGSLTYKLEKNSLDGNISVSKVVILKLPEKKSSKEESLKIPVDLNINVNFKEPITFKTDIWEVKILPVLKITTLNGVPVISGNFFITGGWIDYMGKKFTISYGSGVINNLLTMDGDINIASSTEINDYKIFMYVRGKLSSPTLFFASEPPLTKEEILSLIMTGATPADIERSNELFPVIQIAYYATSNFIKPIEKGLTKLLKLESFYLEPYITRYGETVVKFSLSKRLGSRIRLTGYQTTGQYPEYGIGVQYFIGKKNIYLEYRFSNYYHNEYGVGFDFNLRDWWWKTEKRKR